MKLLPIFALLAAGCTALNAQPSFGVPPVTPPAGHPRILLRPHELTAVRAARHDPALAASWQALRQRAYLPEDYTPEPRYDLAVIQAAEASAFLGLIENESAAKRRAIDLVFQWFGSEGPDRTLKYHALNTFGRGLFAAAAVYDWTHDTSTPAERRRLCQLMREHAGIMEIKFPPTTPNAIAGHSSENQMLRDQMAMAIATYDEDPEIYRLVAGRFYREFTSPRDFHYPGHFHHQGNSYGFVRFGADMGAAMLLTWMGAPPPWSLSAMAQVPYFFLYLRRPDGGLIEDGDDYLAESRPSGSYWAPPAEHWLTYAALFRDPQFATQWRRQLDAVETKFNVHAEPEHPILVILRRPDLIPDATLSHLPLTRYFPEPLGAIIARTGWDIGPDSRDAVAYLKINTHRFDNHQHADSGQFQLFYRGALAIDSGIYQGRQGAYGSPHFVNYFRRSVAHNTLLIEEPSEEFVFDGRPVANDGGQRAIDGAWTMEDFWRQESRTARVVARFIGHDPQKPEVSLIKGDLTAAYAKTKVRHATRTMAFLPTGEPAAPAVLIVLDRVESVRADQRKTALLHSVEEPYVEDNIATLTRTGRQISLQRWNPVAIARESDTAAEVALTFDFRKLAGAHILKAELACRTPWSKQGELQVLAGDRPLGSVTMSTVDPVPLFDVTTWAQNAVADTGTPAALAVKRIGGDSRGALAATAGVDAPHLRLWVREQAYAGKLVQTTLLPEIHRLALRKIGGPDHEFVSGGQNWPNEPRIPDPMAGTEAGAWRIEISDAQAGTTTRFLNVYQVSDLDVPPAPAQLVRGEGIIGAAVRGRVLLAADQGEWIQGGSSFVIEPISAGPDGRALVVITDLPAGDHSLWQDDALIAAAAIEPHGHTWLTWLRPGRYELKSR